MRTKWSKAEGLNDVALTDVFFLQSLPPKIYNKVSSALRSICRSTETKRRNIIYTAETSGVVNGVVLPTVQDHSVYKIFMHFSGSIQLETSGGITNFNTHCVMNW